MSSISRRSCPRLGRRVRFEPNPAARMLYDRYTPPVGTEGSVTEIPIPGGRSTCVPGQRGGLVYVQWDNGRVEGVFKRDLTTVRRK